MWSQGQGLQTGLENGRCDLGLLQLGGLLLVFRSLRGEFETDQLKDVSSYLLSLRLYSL